MCVRARLYLLLFSLLIGKGIIFLYCSQTSEMFYMHLPVLRRGVARIRLRHLVGMSFSFVVIVFVLVFASGKQVVSCNLRDIFVLFHAL